MTIVEVLLYTFLALIITAVFALGFKYRGPWGRIWAFFLIIFLVIWAAGLWIRPAGLVSFGVAWVPLFFVGVIFALIVSAAAPPSNRKTIQDSRKVDPEAGQKPSVVAFSIYFWMVMLILVVAIVVGYFM
jgi:hypothetical protein